MLSNPLVYDKYIRQSSLFLCALAGFVYAFVFGFPVHAVINNVLVDGAVSTILFYIVSALLWNIYTYSVPDSLSIYQRFLLQVFYCMLAVLLITGIESLVAYLVFPEFFRPFTLTLPSRLYCLLLLYVIIYSYYGSNKQCEAEDEEMTVEGDCSLLSEEATSVPEVLERITVKVGRKIKVIPVDELIYLKAEDDYVCIVTADGHWLKNGTMKEYELSLPAGKFARVHRSYIVNISKIAKIERYGQKQLLQLASGESLRISAGGYKILREKLNL